MIHYADRWVLGWRESAALGWARGGAWLPADKSISHRALLFAGLADHPVALHNLNRGAAVTLLVRAMTALGLDIDMPEDGPVVVRRGFVQRRPRHGAVVDLGPSSAAARLLIGVAAGLGIPCVVDGDHTLRERPFEWIVEPLAALGARLHYERAPGRLPIRVEPGAFVGGAARTTIGSAQSVSAVVFAGLAARRAVAIDYPVLSRDHTQRMAAAFGASVDDRLRGPDAGGVLEVQAGALAVPDALVIPRDPSALAYLAALFWLRNRHDPAARVRFDDVGLNPTRLGFFRWAARCGFGYELEAQATRCGEPVGAIVLRGGGALRAAGLASKDELHAMIDEVPLAVAMACLLPGAAAFRDLFELTFKETDRIAATREMLQAFGLRVDVDGYDLLVTGGQTARAASRIPSFGDHRLAMTAHVLLHALGLTATIVEGACHRTSFPGFADALDAIHGARS